MSFTEKITPCGQCRACLSGYLSQCGHGENYEAIVAALHMGEGVSESLKEKCVAGFSKANAF